MSTSGPSPEGDPVGARGSSTTLRVLLALALGWALLLVALSFVLPVVTVSSGHDGVQPRVPLVQHLGAAGAVPAVVLVGAVLASAAVLRWGRAGHVGTWRVVVAQALAVLVELGAVVAVVLTHLTGLLAVPCGVLLLAAAGLAAHRSALADPPAPGDRSATVESRPQQTLP